MPVQETVSSVWPLVLGAFCVWDVYEDWMRQRHTNKYQSWPLPSPEERHFDPSNISLVVPTQLENNEQIKTCLATWLANRPHEIIFVTREDKEGELRDLVSELGAAAEATRIQVFTIQHWHKRDQVVRGVNESEGAIIALVDDDAYWSNETLINLLAPFQDAEVGLVGGPVRSHIPDERRHVDVITSWEVAAFRMRERRDGSMKCAYAADGGINFCVSGCTMLLKSEILKDDEFQDAFLTETWMGKRANSGDDSFITRWILFHKFLSRRICRINAGLLPKKEEGEDSTKMDLPLTKWKLAIQHTPGAVVETFLHPNSKFAGQLRRWYRSGLRLRLTCLFSEPGYHAMKSATPYMARKMLEGMLSPILPWLRIFAQTKSFSSSPSFAWAVFLFNLYLYVKDTTGFFQKFPWCKSHWFAVLVADRLCLVSDLFCWVTLSVESWETRPEVDQDMAAAEQRVSGKTTPLSRQENRAIPLASTSRTGSPPSSPKGRLEDTIVKHKGSQSASIAETGGSDEVFVPTVGSGSGSGSDESGLEADPLDKAVDNGQLYHVDETEPWGKRSSA